MSASKIEWIGIKPDSLSAQQHTKLKAFVDQAGANLLGVRVFPNFDALSDEMPSGMVAIYDLGAKVDASTLSDDLFQTMAVTQILPPASIGTSVTAADDYFASKLTSIQNAVSQMPQAKEMVRETTRLPDNREAHPWAPQLGGRGAFSGVYSCVQDGDTRKKNYYFIVRAGLPNYVADLKRDLAVKQPTFRDLLYGSPWQDRLYYARTASSRNVQRITANLGEACGLAVQRMRDMQAALPNEDAAPPEMAVPDWEHVTHSIERIDWNGKPAVAVSYGIVPASSCLIDKEFFVVANPYDGISRFPLSNAEDVQAAIGLPIDTGRKLDPASLVGAPISAERTRGVIWEGTTKTHPDLHEEAFRPLGKEFKTAMRSMGWNPEHHVERLVPIAVKIGSPNVE